jgi:hypothetical protein
MSTKPLPASPRHGATAPHPRAAVQRWDNEGGSVAPADAAAPAGLDVDVDDAEGTQLRMRVIALEGLVLALLAQGSDAQRAAAVEMAAHILPRPGRTPHALTLRAAARIEQLVERARQLARAVPRLRRRPAAGGRTPP